MEGILRTCCHNTKAAITLMGVVLEMRSWVEVLVYQPNYILTGVR
jgi:hypothetical protein